MKSLIATLMIVASIAASAQHDHSGHTSPSSQSGAPVFRNANLGSAYAHYIHLKDALVASDPQEAKTAAAELEKALASVSNAEKAQHAAKAIAATADVAEQRKNFSALSNEMTALVKSSELTAGSLYVEYCPMANSNRGGYWLSNEKEIRNPYFGDMMLRCGTLKETIQ